MMEIKKTEFGELRVWGPYNSDFDKKIKAAGGQMYSITEGTQYWMVPEEIKINTIRKYMYESYGRSDLDDEREELLSRVADIEDQINKIKGGVIMEKKDVFGGPVILSEDEKEEKIITLYSNLSELCSLGWTDNAARGDEKETFFEMLKGCADGLTEEEVWETWDRVLEETEDHMREWSYSEEKIAAIMSGDDEALEDIEAQEHEKEFEAIMKDLEEDIDLG